MAGTSFVQAVRQAAEGRLPADAANALVNLMGYIEGNSWQGACHACSSVLYVALSECGCDPRICIGECRYGADGIPFDHSWVEVDGKPYDLACAMRLDNGEPICPPVVGGLDVVAKGPTEMRYGIASRGLDDEAQMVRVLPFGLYMDGWPNEPDGLWTVVGICLGRQIDIGYLHRRYVQVERVYVKIDER